MDKASNSEGDKSPAEFGHHLSRGNLPESNSVGVPSQSALGPLTSGQVPCAGAQKPAGARDEYSEQVVGTKETTQTWAACVFREVKVSCQRAGQHLAWKAQAGRSCLKLALGREKSSCPGT